jgi:type VI secretion system secreted protein Hcp
MASDIFLKIDGIKGESQDKAHKGEIDVLGWSIGVNNSGDFHQGSGGGQGKAYVRDLLIEKYLDDSSPEIFASTLKGTHIPEVKLTVRKAGDNPHEYLLFTFKKVLVVSDSVGQGSAHGHIREFVVLHFAEFKVEYETQNEKGGKDEHFAVAFNIAENTIV